MKHEVTTLNTKKAFANALKTCMQTKMLSKITVSEIIAMCGMNRKTFYYHFADIYDCLRWMLDQEAVSVVKQFDMMNDYRDAVVFAVKYVHENKHILNCAYDSMGRDEMKRFFYNDFLGIVGTFIKDSAARLNITPDPNYLDFLIHLYTESIAAMLIDEFKNETLHDPARAMEYMSIILDHSIPAVLVAGP